jgi:hypothetical protein
MGERGPSGRGAIFKVQFRKPFHRHTNGDKRMQNSTFHSRKGEASPKLTNEYLPKSDVQFGGDAKTTNECKRLGMLPLRKRKPIAGFSTPPL